MAGHRFVVVAVMGNREISSPSYGTEEEAQTQLRLISDAQGTANPLKLDWIAVSSGQLIEVAWVIRRSLPRGATVV